MTTIARAWEAFLQAIAEASELNASRADVAAIADLIQHARELLDIIDDEIATNALALPEGAKCGLAEMRARLASIEGNLVTKH